MKKICNFVFLFLFVYLLASCNKEEESKPSFNSDHNFLNNHNFPKDGLVGYYSFNGDFNDRSSNSNNAIGTNEIFTVDRFNHSNGAVQFNGASDFIKIPNLERKINNEWSIIMWAKVDSSNIIGSEFKSVILSFVDSIKSCFVLSCGAGDNSLPYYNLSRGNFPGLSSEGGNSVGVELSNANGFRLFVFTFTDNSSSKYFAGSSYFSESTLSHPEWSFSFNDNRKENDIYLGKSIVDTFDSNSFDNYFTFFKGDIDDLLIYNRKLTTDEIEFFFGKKMNN